MGIYLLDNKQVTLMYTVSQIGNCSHRKKLLFSNGVSLVCKGYLSADPLTRNISPTQMNSKVFFGGFSSHNAVLGLLALKKNLCGVYLYAMVSSFVFLYNSFVCKWKINTVSHILCRTMHFGSGN